MQLTTWRAPPFPSSFLTVSYFSCGTSYSKYSSSSGFTTLQDSPSTQLLPAVSFVLHFAFTGTMTKPSTQDKQWSSDSSQVAQGEVHWTHLPDWIKYPLSHWSQVCPFVP